MDIRKGDKKVKDSINTNVIGASTCEFFEELNLVLGSRDIFSNNFYDSFHDVVDSPSTLAVEEVDQSSPMVIIDSDFQDSSLEKCSANKTPLQKQALQNDWVDRIISNDQTQRSEMMQAMHQEHEKN
ncbi:hypothetical protein CHUAL_010757 [Chamberlinius hualienensis]